MWLNDPTKNKQKLALHWKGPFEVLECLGSDVDCPGVTYSIHYLLDHSDKSQIVHYNHLRPYHAPVPDCGHTTSVSDSLQPQLPCLTALSGALPFKPSGSQDTKNYDLSSSGSASSPAPSTGYSQPRPWSQSLTPPTESLSACPAGDVHQSDSVPSSVSPDPGFLLRSGRRLVRSPRYLRDYVLK